MTAAVVCALCCGQYAGCYPARTAYATTYSYQAAAPAYGYAPPHYYQGGYQPPYDQLYLGYPSPAAYAGYMAQQSRAVAAEQEREQLAADVAAIRKYLAAGAGRRSDAVPVLQAPTVPPKGEPTPDVGGSEQGGPVLPGQPVYPGGPAMKPLPPLPESSPPDTAAPPPPPVRPDAPGGGVSNGLKIPESAVAVWQARCAKCHTGTAEDGGGFAIFSEPGKLADLTPLDVDYMDTRVQAGTMPPKSEGGRLPAADRAASAEAKAANGRQIAAALKAARKRPR